MCKMNNLSTCIITSASPHKGFSANDITVHISVYTAGLAHARYLSRFAYKHPEYGEKQLGFMMEPPLWMLCCHVRPQQLIEMDEHGLVLSSLYPLVLLEGSRADSGLQNRSGPPPRISCFIVIHLQRTDYQLLRACWNFSDEPEGRNLSRRRLTTSSNMV